MIPNSGGGDAELSLERSQVEIRRRPERLYNLIIIYFKSNFVFIPEA